jgi:hypothetical protein
VTEPAGTPADDLLALPASSEILAVARVVLSLWHETSCVSTFRLRRTEVPLLVHALVGGLAAAPASPPRP